MEFIQKKYSFSVGIFCLLFISIVLQSCVPFIPSTDEVQAPQAEQDVVVEEMEKRSEAMEKEEVVSEAELSLVDRVLRGENIPELDKKEPIVPLNEIVAGGPPKDGIPPIDNPQFVSLEDAASFVQDTTWGILVKVGKDVRFYPYNILNWHEIVNDKIGDMPLSVTFCPLCGTGIVFEREINGVIYDFGTSGKLWESNLVMYDRQTDSYWSQVLGLAIVGDLVGIQLEVYPSSITQFSTVKKEHPDAVVLSVDTGHSRDYQKNPYQGYEESEYMMFGVSEEDDRLHPKELIYSISIDGHFKAYHFKNLLKQKELIDAFQGHQLQITVGPDDEIIVNDLTEQQQIYGFVAMWFSWVTHHETGELWTGE